MIRHSNQTEPTRIPTNKNEAWTEKYRPTNFADIVLNDTSQQLFESIVRTKCVPNLLLHGPPGTGKTTAILNLKRSLYTPNEIRELTIHLNASDDRGVDIIRKQISLFVKSNNIFATGCKIVILDEVDYMTDAAQRELVSVIEEFGDKTNVSFILMCNYYSRIDARLANYFINVPFSSLGIQSIAPLLRRICETEGIVFNESGVEHLVDFYNSDVRSILNHIQTNGNMHVPTESDIEVIHQLLVSPKPMREAISEFTHLCGTMDLTELDAIHHHSTRFMKTYPDIFARHIRQFKLVNMTLMMENSVDKIGFYIALIKRINPT
jgi:DNA polymerase III delta prime subunit